MPFVRSIRLGSRGEFAVLIRMLLVMSIAAILLALVAGSGERPPHGPVRCRHRLERECRQGRASPPASLPPDNPLHESRMYAMTHVAIHDALNAIDRRSRPYALDATARRASVSRRRRGRGGARRAGPAAPRRSRRRSRRRAAPRASRASRRTTRRRSRAIPDGRAKTRGHRARAGRRRGHPRPASRRTARTRRWWTPTTRRAPSPASTASRPGSRFRVRAGLGRRHPVRAEGQLAVPSRSAVPGDREKVRRRPQRGEAPRRRRRHHAQRTHRRADRDRPLLGRELAAAVEPDRPNRLRQPRARSRGSRRGCSACSTWLSPTATSARFDTKYHYNYWRPVTAIQNADADGNPQDQRRPDVDPAGADSSHPGLRLGAQRRGRRRSAGPEAVLRHRPHQLRDLQPDAAGRKHVRRRRRPCSVATAASRKRPRRTASRASSSASTSARRSTKGIEHGRKIGNRAVDRFLRPEGGRADHDGGGGLPARENGRIAFESDRDGGDFDIWTMRPDGSSLRQPDRRFRGQRRARELAGGRAKDRLHERPRDAGQSHSPRLPKPRLRDLRHERRRVEPDPDHVQRARRRGSRLVARRPEDCLRAGLQSRPRRGRLRHPHDECRRHGRKKPHEQPRCPGPRAQLVAERPENRIRQGSRQRQQQRHLHDAPRRLERTATHEQRPRQRVSGQLRDGRRRHRRMPSSLERAIMAAGGSTGPGPRTPWPTAVRPGVGLRAAPGRLRCHPRLCVGAGRRSWWDSSSGTSGLR